MSAGKLPKSPDVPRVMGGLEEEYEIVSELGRGGTAVVYLAKDRALDREVAVKVIRSTYVEDEEAVARLVREARTVGQLQHPNIVMLYGTRRLDDNSLALIMQYVPGRPLKAVIRNDGPLPFKMVSAVLDDIASALSYAHRQRIVHRDIKPENIYLDEAVEVARLADFGIARHWDKDAGITLPGMAIGTPTYMSPEQIDGASLDGRSDIYSLGIVGYEMLTGQQPWAGENLYSIIYKQKREQLPALDEVRPGVPHELQEAVEGALKKRPEDRWQSAEEFLACLRGLDLEEVISRHGAKRAQDQAEVTPRPGEGTTDGPVSLEPDVDENAMTIRYRRPTEHEVQAAVDDGEPEEEGAPTFVLEERAPGWGLDEEEEGDASRPSLRRVALLAILAFVSAGLAFTTFASTRDGGGETVDPGPGVVTDPVGAGGTTASGGEDPGAARAGFPARMEVVGGSLLTGMAGEATGDPIRIQVFDEVGSPLRGALVELAVASGGGRVTPRMGEADADGVVEARWVLGTAPQRDVVTAKLVGGPEDAILTLEARRRDGGVIAQNPVIDDPGSGTTPRGGTATASGVAMVSVVSGRGQQAAPGTELDQPIRIQVLDTSGDPVEDATVLFEPAAGHGTASSTSVTTDAQGFAESRWTLGEATGPQRLRITVAGSDAFTLTDATAAAEVVSTLRPRSAVVAGATHACAVTSGGSASCWGGNTFGQLGTGGGAASSRPAAVAGGLSFARLAAGFSATCGIATTGETYCWGRNEVGELGDGTTIPRASPNRVAGNRAFVDVYVGATHVCARTSSGQAFCWGLNDSGQLGDGSTADRTRPAPVGGGHRFRSLATGWNHTCGIAGTETYCWGANDRGQLGTGSGANESSPTPVDVSFGFTQISAGGSHTCGVSASGVAYCWGRNQYGQLGDGSTADQETPVPVVAELAFRQVAAGPVHTCGLTGAGSAYCWGRNDRGQLGDGTTIDRSAPTPVEGGLSFTSLDVNGAHTCGQASNGGVYCWGYNSDGQVGDGSRQSRSRPTRVGG